MNLHFFSILLFFNLLLTANFLKAQHSSILGYVYDAETKEPLLYADAILSEGEDEKSTFIIGMQADLNGFFNIPVEAGNYFLTINAMGYETEQLNITVAPGRNHRYEIKLKERHVIIGPPILEPTWSVGTIFGTEFTLQRKQIEKMPIRR